MKFFQFTKILEVIHDIFNSDLHHWRRIHLYHFSRKLGNQSKPLVTVAAVDDKTLSFKQQSLVKTTEFSCQIGVPFEETTADGRKVS